MALVSFSQGVIESVGSALSSGASQVGSALKSGASKVASFASSVFSGAGSALSSAASRSYQYAQLHKGALIVFGAAAAIVLAAKILYNRAQRSGREGLPNSSKPSTLGDQLGSSNTSGDGSKLVSSPRAALNQPNAPASSSTAGEEASAKQQRDAAAAQDKQEEEPGSPSKSNEVTPASSFGSSSQASGETIKLDEEQMKLQRLPGIGGDASADDQKDNEAASGVQN